LKYDNYGFNSADRSKKNRAFFFWNEEWRREKRGLVPPLQFKVPTAAERAGDFSAPKAQLTDTLPHRLGLTCDPNNPLNYGSNPVDPGCFPGNKIPTAQLSPAGLAIMNFFPLPNTTGSNNFVFSPIEPVNTRQDSIRGDINISKR